MRKKEAGAKIIMGVFLIVICSSQLWWILLEKYMDSENYENREMAERPSLSADTYLTFADDYTAYFNDSIPFRNNLISLNNGIDYFIFNRSSNESVIAGKDHWLFFVGEGEGNSISCYQGTNLYTEEELAAIARNCINQRDFLLSLDKEFVIFIAPNKERVYYEYMPSQYGMPADNYGALQIYNYLKANTDLKVVYPYAELMDAKKKIKENICYKTDTHWNYIGGYVGAAALLKELGIEMPVVYSDEITITAKGNISGDLADMLDLGKLLKFADKEYTVDGYKLHDCTETEAEFLGMVHYQATDADPRTLYMIRDSFATNMVPYIGSQFNESFLRHQISYSCDDMISCDPDIVVYEIVERNADDLARLSIR